jgi:hypothetical protein
MKGVELYRQVRRAVYVEGLSRRYLRPPRMIRLSASSRTAGYRQSIETSNEFARIKL